MLLYKAARVFFKRNINKSLTRNPFDYFLNTLLVKFPRNYEENYLNSI